MGLIREPHNVDFYVLDKPWTDKERIEFSALIKLHKEKRKKRARRTSTVHDSLQTSSLVFHTFLKKLLNALILLIGFLKMDVASYFYR